MFINDQYFLKQISYWVGFFVLKQTKMNQFKHLESTLNQQPRLSSGKFIGGGTGGALGARAPTTFISCSQEFSFLPQKFVLLVKCAPTTFSKFSRTGKIDLCFVAWSKTNINQNNKKFEFKASLKYMAFKFNPYFLSEFMVG